MALGSDALLGGYLNEDIIKQLYLVAYMQGKKFPSCLGISGKSSKVQIFGDGCTAAGMESMSYGYHSNGGKIYHNSKELPISAPSYGESDVIGCGVNFVTNSVFFTKNGVFIGLVNTGKKLPYPIYPCIAFASPNCYVSTNFGRHKFAFDIGQYIARERALAIGTAVERKCDDQLANVTMRNIVATYLLHNGYLNSAQSFAQWFDKPCQSSTSDEANTSAADVIIGSPTIPNALADSPISDSSKSSSLSSSIASLVRTKKRDKSKSAKCSSANVAVVDGATKPDDVSAKEADEDESTLNNLVSWPETIEMLLKRCSLRDTIKSGHYMEAFEQLQTNFKHLSDLYPSIMFVLRCHHFIDMIGQYHGRSQYKSSECSSPLKVDSTNGGYMNADDDDDEHEHDVINSSPSEAARCWNDLSTESLPTNGYHSDRTNQTLSHPDSISLFNGDDFNDVVVDDDDDEDDCAIADGTLTRKHQSHANGQATDGAYASETDSIYLNEMLVASNPSQSNRADVCNGTRTTTTTTRDLFNHNNTVDGDSGVGEDVSDLSTCTESKVNNNSDRCNNSTSAYTSLTSGTSSLVGASVVDYHSNLKSCTCLSHSNDDVDDEDDDDAKRCCADYEDQCSVHKITKAHCNKYAHSIAQTHSNLNHIYPNTDVVSTFNHDATTCLSSSKQRAPVTSLSSSSPKSPANSSSFFLPSSTQCFRQNKSNSLHEFTFGHSPNTLKKSACRDRRILQDIVSTFVQQDRERELMDLIEYGRNLRATALQLQQQGLISLEQLLLLTNAFSLIAYKNPFKSPLKSLLHSKHREHLADAVNDAILVYLKQSPRSVLDTALAYLDRAFNQEEKDVINRDLYSFSLYRFKENKYASQSLLHHHHHHHQQHQQQQQEQSDSVTTDTSLPQNIPTIVRSRHDDTVIISRRSNVEDMIAFDNDNHRGHSDDSDLSIIRPMQQTTVSVQTQQSIEPTSTLISDSQSYVTNLIDIVSDDAASNDASNGLSNVLLRPASFGSALVSATSSNASRTTHHRTSQVSSAPLSSSSTSSTTTSSSSVSSYNRSFNRMRPISLQSLIHQRRQSQTAGEQASTSVSTATTHMVSRIISSHSNWPTTIATMTTMIATGTTTQRPNTVSTTSGRSTTSTGVSTLRASSQESSHISRLTSSRNANPIATSTSTNVTNTLTNVQYAPSGSELAGFFHPILFIS